MLRLRLYRTACFFIVILLVFNLVVYAVPFAFHSRKASSTKPTLTTNTLFDHAFGGNGNKHSYVEIPSLETDKIDSTN